MVIFVEGKSNGCLVVYSSGFSALMATSETKKLDSTDQCLLPRVVFPIDDREERL